MTYAAALPAPAAEPAAAPRRPLTVRLAATLLAVMGLAGLAYAIATIAITPGVLDRFRDAVPGADVDSYVTVVWMTAAIGAVLAVVLFALYIVLALGLRRGSHGFRVGTWVVCGLGMLSGCGSAAAVAAQRAGDGTPGTLGYELSSAYPGSWIPLNVAFAIAQVLGYVVVAGLLMASPREFFRRTDASSARPHTYVALPTYGSQQVYPAGSPAQQVFPTQQAPGFPTQQAGLQAQPAPGFPAQPVFPAAPAVSPEDHAAWARPSAQTPAAPAAPTPAPTPAAAADEVRPASPAAPAPPAGPSAASDEAEPATDRPDDGHSPHQSS
jgi:hypothetical protein